MVKGYSLIECFDRVEKKTNWYADPSSLGLDSTYLEQKINFWLQKCNKNIFFTQIVLYANTEKCVWRDVQWMRFRSDQIGIIQYKTFIGTLEPFKRISFFMKTVRKSSFGWSTSVLDFTSNFWGKRKISLVFYI